MLTSLIRRKIKKFSAPLMAAGCLLSFLLVPLPASAQLQPGGPSSTPGTQTTLGDCNANGAQLNSSNCGIIKYVVVITNILSALVGIVIVMSIVWGGIQYSMARSDPQAVAAARKRIYNAILALILYVFMFALLQWLIPGGVF